MYLSQGETGAIQTVGQDITGGLNTIQRILNDIKGGAAGYEATDLAQQQSGAIEGVLVVGGILLVLWLMSRRTRS